MALVEKSLPVMVGSKRLWKKYASQQDAYLALRPLWKTHSSADLVPENCGIKGTEKAKEWLNDVSYWKGLVKQPIWYYQQLVLQSRLSTEDIEDRYYQGRSGMLLAQDRHEIFIVMADYDAEYVEYLTSPERTADYNSFLTMNEFGP
ncbi:hypothetical protein CIHG_05051 [Coccidioides immitis H538.4]|uniref:Uncharacterized protein n=3 Tax=Coccidioides immitis TaxID=5501 RepID=A0A0J8QLZ1_COCIT|nr:hypothetical protein CIRG_03984 [Coccidioides immitis RMSCC 2394]KMU73424.1 hypothetical protein CISG_03559 [Coccidioides immitis RMSCC 3703]KMU87111.1 hypothetical protein CIHG_05051 [Coccidioides immitis H538.4]